MAHMDLLMDPYIMAHLPLLHTIHQMVHLMAPQYTITVYHIMNQHQHMEYLNPML